jgi:hypothetical protein
MVLTGTRLQLDFGAATEFWRTPDLVQTEIQTFQCLNFRTVTLIIIGVSKQIIQDFTTIINNSLVSNLFEVSQETFPEKKMI